MLTIIFSVLSFALGYLICRTWFLMHIDGVLEIDHSSEEHDTVHIKIDSDPTKKKYVVLEVKDNAIISQEEQGLL